LEITARDASDGLGLACSEPDDLPEVAGLQASACELALLTVDQCRMLAWPGDNEPVGIGRLARDAAAASSAHHAELSPQDLVDLARGRRRHHNARVLEAAVVPERDPRGGVRLADFVARAHGDARVVTDSFNDLDLLRPRLDP
jgi:hypothetical protein